MLSKILSEINENDIEFLMRERIPEGISLEYKKEFPGKDRLLATVCAFANTGNGDLVLGVEEKDNYIQSIPGIDEADVETVKGRIEQLVRSGMEPPGVAIECREIRMQSGRWVIVVRISQSWISPHRVTDGYRFYRRTSMGNAQMSVDELRRAFLAQDSARRSAREFREERVRGMYDRIYSANPTTPPHVMLHLMPMSALHDDIINIHLAYKNIFALSSPRITFDRRSYNLDGVISTVSGSFAGQFTKVQVFRNGAVEFVARLPTESQGINTNTGDRAFLSPERIIEPIMPGIEKLLKMLSVAGPIYAFLSLVGINGHKILTSEPNHFTETYGEPYPGVWMMLPEVEVGFGDDNILNGMRYSFDVMWQAFQRQGSPFYNDSGLIESL